MKVLKVFIFAILLSISTNARAEIIHFKDGSVVQGEIMSTTGVDITVMFDGKVQKYYKDNILRIDEEEEFFGEDIDLNIEDYKGMSKQKIQLIIKYLEGSGIKSTMESQLEKTIAEADPEYEALLRQIFDIETVISKLIPVYNKHYTEEELTVLANFYTSEARKTEVESMPEVLKESLQILTTYITRQVSGAAKDPNSNVLNQLGM